MTVSPDSKGSEHRAIREAASDWHTVLQDDQVSLNDRAGFQQWLNEDSRHGEAYERVRQVWAKLDAVTEADLADDVRASLATARAGGLSKPAPIAEPGHRSGRYRHLAAAAAAAVIVLCVSLAVSFREPPLETSVATFDSTTAELKTVELADGSSVTLGADSRIQFTDTARARLVVLQQGQAYFDVARDAQRPFTVTAQALRIRVTGTRFAVRRGSRQSEVAVSEGAVQVSHPLMIGGVPQLSESVTHRLSAGEAIIATRQAGLAEPSTVRPEAIAAWRRGRLVYVAAPLVDMIEDMNRYTPKFVRIADERLVDLRVSGSFDAANPDQTLNTLAEILPILIDRSSGNDIRILRKEG